MFRDDTIAAIATPEGSGSIGVIRISGIGAKHCLKKFFRSVLSTFVDFCPWKLHRGYLCDNRGAILDDVLAVYMPAPNTFTGEDVVELHCHGSYILLTVILEALLAEGVRLANRGEFSYRAFLNGRIDLTQAEAIAELISASSIEEVKLASNRLNGLVGRYIKKLHKNIVKVRTLLCLAIDFSEEDIEDIFTKDKFIHELESIHTIIKNLLGSFERSKCWSSGVVVALVGLVNAGKSSLFNAMLGQERAIVTDYPGTTRDFLEGTIYVSGLPIRIIDTAGHRLTSDPIEVQGIYVGKEKAHNADIVLLVIDSTQGLTEEIQSLITEFHRKYIIYVWNKIDLVTQAQVSINYDMGTSINSVYTSAKTGSGIDELMAQIQEYTQIIKNYEPKPDEVIPNVRQASVLSEALQEINSLIHDIKLSIPYDICAVRLESLATMLSSIIGSDTPEDILNGIFASFCIGK